MEQTATSTAPEASSPREQDIISVLGYRRFSLDAIVIDTEDLKRKCPLDNAHHTILPHPNPASLGDLERLPAEIIELVLLHLDFSTLTAFRAVNHRALYCVGSLLPYQTLYTHAPAALRALLATGTAAHFSLWDIYAAFCSYKCSRHACTSDYAPFLFLPACQRVCLPCATVYPEFLPISSRSAKRTFSLNSRAMAALPRTKCLPGEYSFRRVACRSRQNLVSSVLARETGIHYNGAYKTLAGNQLGPSVGPESNNVDLYPSTTYFTTAFTSECFTNTDKKALDARRFMGLVRFPALISTGRRSKIIEWGVACEGCARECEYARGEVAGNGPGYPGRAGWQERFHAWNRMYTREGFLVHIKDCDAAKRIWSEEGGDPRGL